jgi:hypothetical protein
MVRTAEFHAKNKVIEIFYLVSFVVFLLVIPQEATANGTCNEAPSQIKKIIQSMPKLKSSDLTEGSFTVKKKGEMFAISYVIKGKVFNVGTIPKDFDDNVEVQPIRISKYGALYIKGCSGAGGRYCCSWIVYPLLKKNCFQSLVVGHLTSIIDLNHDGEAEIEELEYISDFGCGLPMCNMVYWHRLLHVSPQTGKIIDVSDQFPQYYAKLLKEYREIYNSVDPQNRTNECINGFNEYLGRLEKLSTRSK